ncbi:isocitrate lyase/PEP mutase family protein [Streptosporangium roseum]|uniref:isocitrate lyase/PEP mutase family protein n=1 Tax=Streptosporangium roseum TaxID=2001 RepID=UPI00055D6267|nr:isocitrate lyase/phosphoenolpyruvate mutase family protein [Streptosporangium roseum]
MTFERFRALHHGTEPLLLPNAWDHASAAALAAAGFAAVGTTSLGVAAAAGLPDAEQATRAQTVSLARGIATLGVPVTVDIEGGFGGPPARVADLAAELAAAGVAGVNIEDGRGQGLAETAEQVALIGAIKQRAPRLFVNARTDPFWLRAPDALATAVHRVRAYADAGADGVFVPGATGERQIQALVAAAPVPLNVLIQAEVPVARLAALGVARISYGSLLFRAALRAAVTTALQVAGGAPVPGDLPSYEQVQRLRRRPAGADPA